MALGEALARIIRDETELLISRGIRLIQLNNFRYGAYLFARNGRPLTLDEAIVDPTVAELEDVETVMQRMDAAADLKDIEDIAVTPSAGFSDPAGAAALTQDDQRRKLVHVETIARMCWGNEL